LKSIIIPHSVEFIDSSAFTGLYLDLIVISAGDSRFRVSDSFLEDIRGRSIVRYFGHCKSVIILSSIEVLCKFCFSKCESLSSIIFESGSHLQRIERLAFYESGLISIVIPSSVEILCRSCFEECLSIESITLENDSQLAQIKSRAFHKCSAFVGISECSLSGFRALANCSMVARTT
jgi:hypothetical protein